MVPVAQFRKNGFEYRLILTGDRSCIYEQLYCQKPKVSYYEIFQIRTRKAGERFGKVHEDEFRIPGNEDFGKWAWVTRDFEKAKQMFDKLEKE